MRDLHEKLWLNKVVLSYPIYLSLSLYLSIYLSIYLFLEIEGQERFLTVVITHVLENSETYNNNNYNSLFLIKLFSE